MRIRNSAGVPLDNSDGCQTLSSLGKTDGTGKFDVSGTFELVKTGDVTGGTLGPTGGSGYYNTGVLNTGVVLNNGYSYIYFNSGTVVKAVTCSVTAATANQTVPIPKAISSTLAATGAVSSKTPFSIALTCQSGVKVNVTFSDAAGASGVSSVVKSTGTATGIGIQLLDATSAPIVLDQALTVVDSTTGNMSIPFFAQYYRLSTGTATGTVQAAATYTMSYQ
jgi:type 1 fimbria pilin